MSDVMYAPLKPYGDNNILEPNFNSLRQSISSSFTGQVEPLFSNFQIKVPHIHNIVDGGFQSLFEIVCYDRIGAPKGASNYRLQNFRLEDTGSVTFLALQPVPLSAKSNWICRFSACDIKITMMISSSSITQGIVSFYMMRNQTRKASTPPVFQHMHTLDSANSIAHLNISTDKNITITIPYDERFSLTDYGYYDDTLQHGIRSLVAIPSTPLTTTTGDPSEIYATIHYGITNVRATGFMLAPNLTLFSTNPPVIKPLSKDDNAIKSKS